MSVKINSLDGIVEVDIESMAEQSESIKSIQYREFPPTDPLQATGVLRRVIVEIAQWCKLRSKCGGDEDAIAKVDENFIDNKTTLCLNEYYFAAKRLKMEFLAKMCWNKLSSKLCEY